MTAIERSRSSVFFCRRLKLRSAEDVAGVGLSPARYRVLHGPAKRAGQSGDRYLGHHATQKVRLCQQLSVHEVPVRLNRDAVEDRPAEQLERARRIPKPQPK